MNTKRMTELGLLTSLALIIFIVELRIPNLVPIPGVKLGLANIITVYAVYHYKAKEAAMIVFCRILLGSVFSGNISSLLYSASGAFLCLLGMLALRHIFTENQIWICSVFGALFHNTGQMIAAVIIMKTVSVVAYFPILVFSGTIAGAFTGLCAMIVIKRFDRHFHKKKFNTLL